MGFRVAGSRGSGTGFRVESLGFSVEGIEFRVEGIGLGLEYRVRVEDIGCRPWR